MAPWRAIAAESSADWLQYQGGPAHAGAAAPGAAEPPYERAWRFRAPEKWHGVSGAVVSGDLVIAEGRSHVYALDRETGEEVWTASRNAGPLPGAFPAVAQAEGRSLLLFTEGAIASKAKLRAVDAETGEPAWELRLNDTTEGAVAVEGELAFVSDRSGTLYAVRLADGTLAWKLTFSGQGKTAELVPDGGFAYGPPALAGGRLYLSLFNETTGLGTLAAIEAETGEATGKGTWSFHPRPAAYASVPTVVGDDVFVGFYNRVMYRLDAATGAEVWSSPVNSLFYPYTAPAVADGAVYALASNTSTRESGLYAFDSEDGDRRWWFELAVADVFSSPVVVGDAVIVGLANGAVVAIDRERGVRIWQAPTSGGAVGPITPAGDLLIVSKSSRLGGLVALRHDPNGTLTADPSPTEADPLAAARDYGLALAAVGGSVTVLGLLLTRWARNRRPGDEDDEDDEDDDSEGDADPDLETGERDSEAVEAEPAEDPDDGRGARP